MRGARSETRKQLDKALLFSGSRAQGVSNTKMQNATAMPLRVDVALNKTNNPLFVPRAPLLPAEQSTIVQ